MSWKEFTIGELCIKVTDGSHFSPKELTEGYPMFSVKDMTENGFDYSDVKRISKEDYLKLERGDCKPKKGDVLIAKDGSYLKHVFVCKEEKEEAILSSIAILRPDKNKIEAEYFMHLLRTPSVKGMMESFVSGSALPRIVLKDFKKMKLSIPEPKTQQRIASILSAYDDLLEVNNQRIKLLEETARELYKEWFVRMRFPGYKQAKFVKGVPEGWEVKPMASLCSRITDGTHDTPMPLESGYPLITGKHIIDGFIDFTSTYYISEKDHRQISKRSGLNKGDILLSNIGTIGSASIVDYENEFSVKNIIIYKPLKIEYSAFIYYYLTNPATVEQFMSDAFGTSQQFLSLGYCRKLKAFIPLEDLILKFDQIVSPMIKLKYTLQQQSTQLRQIRDRLLPRLISGKLEVKGGVNG